MLLRMLREISYLVDEALADRIIEAERIKTAEMRVELYEREAVGEEVHMCLMPGCRKPVFGKLIFAHCETHFKPWEKRWREEKRESKDWKRPVMDDSDTPASLAAQRAIDSRDTELIMENVRKKNEALTEARNLLNKAYAEKSERWAYLPRMLQKRLDNASQSWGLPIGTKDLAG
jgi:hypothetical protein